MMFPVIWNPLLLLLVAQDFANEQKTIGANEKLQIIIRQTIGRTIDCVKCSNLRRYRNLKPMIPLANTSIYMRS